jgi:small subunit ribosomal protein S20
LYLSRPNRPPANNRGPKEIQPHQHLISLFRSGLPVSKGPESVDAARRALYKDRQWRRVQSRRRCSLSGAVMRAIFAPTMAFSGTPGKNTSVDHAVERPARSSPTTQRPGHRRRIFENMANTTSAKKATRKIARRTIINKSRRTQMRGSVRIVEEAIKSGDRNAALKAMARAEPELMQAAQRNIIHKNNASRKVSRLAHQIAKLPK